MANEVLYGSPDASGGKTHYVVSRLGTYDFHGSRSALEYSSLIHTAYIQRLDSRQYTCYLPKRGTSSPTFLGGNTPATLG